MRPAMAHSLSTEILERALVVSAIVAAGGTVAGAYLARSGYGWPSLAILTCGALVAFGVGGVWAQDVAVRRQRGELARVYSAAAQGYRGPDRRSLGPSTLESLTLSL